MEVVNVSELADVLMEHDAQWTVQEMRALEREAGRRPVPFNRIKAIGPSVHTVNRRKFWERELRTQAMIPEGYLYEQLASAFYKQSRSIGRTVSRVLYGRCTGRYRELEQVREFPKQVRALS